MSIDNNLPIIIKGYQITQIMPLFKQSATYGENFSLTFRHMFLLKVEKMEQIEHSL